MPTTVSYPGVYVEEIPSGVRTLIGVPTSVTAFVGMARRGLSNEPVTVNGFADFEREFGGLWSQSTMSYAVRDFFLNGGGQAVIVRIHNGAEASKVEGLQNWPTFEAKSEGKWGDGLQVLIEAVPGDPDRYNLRVRDSGTGEEERHLNIDVGPSAPDKPLPRSVDKVLASSSRLLKVTGSIPTAAPTPSDAPDPGQDPFTKAAGAKDGKDGTAVTAAEFEGDENEKTGIYALLKLEASGGIFNLLCLPPPDRDTDLATGTLSKAVKLCVDERAMLIVDPPTGWTSVTAAATNLSALGISGVEARNAAVFFPRLKQPDPEQDYAVDTFVPSGAVAGVFARTDTQRGVWKAPAGLDATLGGVPELTVPMTDAENGQLNPLGINCLRAFPVHGRLVWGSRTLRGADQAADEYKYIPVRRTALFIEETLYRGLKWVVFEPNDEPLWAQIRLNVGAFMQGLFRQGAFQGKTPREAYFVKCDKETTTQNDIDKGIVNIVVGFAPLKPAEFVIIKLQQMAGQLET